MVSAPAARISMAHPKMHGPSHSLKIGTICTPRSIENGLACGGKASILVTATILPNVAWRM